MIRVIFEFLQRLLELLDAHLQQIERCNPQVNAFVMLFGEQARQEAASAEKRLDEGAEIGGPSTDTEQVEALTEE